MAGRGDIAAGRAHVELLLKGAAAFEKGLDSAGQKLKGFGGGVAAIGAAITGAGTLIGGALFAALNHFQSAGDALDKMSARTGISAQAYAELGFAAEQSGAELEVVEKGIAKMQRNITDGSKSVTGLGLSLTTLKSLSPEDQFNAVADAINDIKHPSERAAAAIGIFGKSGAQLLPMLADLKALRQEARDLGLVPDQNDIDRAASVNDAMNRIKRTVGAVVFNIGGALAEAFLKIEKPLTAIIVSVNTWVRENRSLFLTVAQVTGVLLVVGAAITGLGLSFVVAGAALSGLASALGVVTAVIGAILSPLGLITAALVGGAAWWAFYSESGKAAIGSLMEAIAPILETFKTTFGGLKDALSAGELALAGQIAMVGLKTAFLQGVAALASAVGGQWGDFIGTFGGQIAGGDLSGAWSTVVSGLASVWAQFTEGIVNVFADAVNGIINLWKSATQAISDFILQDAAEGGILGTAALMGTGVDMKSEKGKAEWHRIQDISNTRREMEDEQADLEKAKAGGGKMTNEAGDTFTTEEIQARIDDLNKTFARLNASPVDFVGQTQRDARNILAGQADAAKAAVKGPLDAVIAAAEQSNREAQAKARQATGGGASKAQEAADASAAELAKLREQASAAKQAADAEDEKRRQKSEEDGGGNTADLKQNLFSTFSAAALLAGGAGSPFQPMVNEQKRTNKHLEDIKQKEPAEGEFRQ